MSYYKSLFKNYIILIALVVFTVVYIIINFDAVKQGDIYNGDLTKSLLITGIIVLLSYLFVTWDDDKEITEYNDITTNYPDNNYQNEKNNFNMEGGVFANEPYGIKKFNLANVTNNQPTTTIVTNLPVINNSSKPINLASNISNNIQTNIPTNIPSNNIQNQVSQPVITVGNQTNQINQINELGFENPNKSVGESKYYILNQNINPIKQPNNLINLTNTKNALNKYDNPNIFISHKNTGKFGIKF